MSQWEWAKRAGRAKAAPYGNGGSDDGANERNTVGTHPGDKQPVLVCDGVAGRKCTVVAMQGPRCAGVRFELHGKGGKI